MRIAVYLRVSTLRQAQAQSIEQQLNRLREHISERGWSLPDGNIFRDDGYSGAKLNRPGLDRLRDKVRMAEVDCILITSPDRLARDFVHQRILLDEFKGYHCQVEFLDRSISDDPHDQLLLQIQGAVAEYERTLIADRMRRGRLAKYQAGLLLPWSTPPYGYRVDPDRPRDPAGVIIEPSEAALVQQIFAWYAEDGATLYTVTKRLYQCGIKTPKGRSRWPGATIRGILTNPAYIGQVYLGRTRMQPPQRRRSAIQPVGKRPDASQVQVDRNEWMQVATIPAIVSQSQFDLAQAKLARNIQTARRNNTANEYLLRALVSCGLCQLACYGRADDCGHHYYVCRAKAATLVSPRDEPCRSRYIPVRRLDDLVWEDLCKVITYPEVITHALERAWAGNWLPQELQARRENLRKGRKSLDQQIERLTQAYLSEIIQLEEFQRRRSDLEEKRRVLEGQEQQLQAQVERKLELAGVSASIESFCQRIQAGLKNATFENKRQLVELLIDRVVVTNEEVEVRYVIPTGPDGEKFRFCHLHKDYFDQILPGVAFVIHLVTYAQSLIGADPIAIPELTAVIGDDFLPQSPLQERLEVNVQEHTGLLIRRQRAGKDGS